MQISEPDIGSGRVRRGFRRGEEWLPAGKMLTAADVLAIAPANRRALSEAGFIELYPRGPVESVGQRHIVHLGRGQYDVIHGVKLNAQPLSKEEAEDLATQPGQ